MVGVPSAWLLERCQQRKYGKSAYSSYLSTVVIRFRSFCAPARCACFILRLYGSACAVVIHGGWKALAQIDFLRLPICNYCSQHNLRPNNLIIGELILPIDFIGLEGTLFHWSSSRTDLLTKSFYSRSKIDDDADKKELPMLQQSQRAFNIQAVHDCTHVCH